MENDLVIKGLECCSKGAVEPYVPTIRECANCPYNQPKIPCTRLLAADALALLKAQEPKPPIITENAYGWKFYHCPSCGREFYGDRLHCRMNKTAFCDKCGQAVRWDGLYSGGKNENNGENVALLDIQTRCESEG